MTRLWWPWRSFGALAAYYAVTCAALLAAGHPAWRTAGVAACWLVQGAGTLWFTLRGTAPVELGTYPPGVLRLGLAHLATSGAAVALTGGLAGPLWPILLRPSLTSLALFGWMRECKLRVAATAALLVALALLPSPWAGPAISGPVFDVLAAASVLTTVAVVSMNLLGMRRGLRDTARELARVREELATQALARARSLEEVGTQVAHELKNPLAAVKALAQLGAADGAAAETRPAFAAIEAEVARMQEILREYLSFSRPLEELRRERVELGPPVDDVLAALAGRARRAGVRLARRGHARANADARRLGEAVLNLVANAIEATPRGGEVDVELAELEGAARIVVRDTGAGMTSEVLARVGTPFFTTREGGTGLGVVLARAAFHQHGGTLRFESAPGSGTAATGTLPLEAAPEAASAPAPSAAVRLRWPWPSFGVVFAASSRRLAQAREELASHALARGRIPAEVGARVARELAAPLAAVAALAREGGARLPGGAAREWLAVIGREAARMQGILDEYVAFARPRLRYESSPGRGTTVTATLPRGAETAGANGSPSRAEVP